MHRLVIASMFAAHVAAAQPPGEVAPVEREGEKSVASAYLVTLGATSGPCVAGAILGADAHGAREAAGGMLCTAGLVLGPTAGHWYAGERITTGSCSGSAALPRWRRS